MFKTFGKLTQELSNEKCELWKKLTVNMHLINCSSNYLKLLLET